eukprot:scaffold47123_cov39-Attheya_sp.AAC.3
MHIFWYINLGHSFGVARGQRVECGRDFQSAAPLRRSSQRASRRCNEGGTQHDYIIATYMNRFIMTLGT